MVYLAADHRGLLRREEIKKWLSENKIDCFDVGNDKLDPLDDEIDFVSKACEQIETDLAKGAEPRGIFFCGSGVMADITANRLNFVRSVLGFTPSQVAAARNDDNVNVLCLGADFVNFIRSVEMVRAFLETPFSGEMRFKRRLAKLETLKSTK